MDKNEFTLENIFDKKDDFLKACRDAEIYENLYYRLLECKECKYDFMKAIYDNFSMFYSKVTKFGLKYEECYNFSDVSYTSSTERYSFLLSGVSKYSKKHGTVRYGFIDQYGKEIIKCKYKKILDDNFINGGINVEDMRGNVIFISINGMKLLMDKDARCFYFSDDILTILKNDKWGFIKINGDPMTPYIYDYASGFLNGCAIINKDGLMAFIDKNGKEHPGYDDVVFSDRCHNVLIREIFDYKGNRIKNKYDVFYSKTQSLYTRKNNKWACVDYDGKHITDHCYDIIGIKKNCDICFYNGGWGILNSAGDVIVKPVYANIGIDKDKNKYRAYLRNSLFVGIIDRVGKVLIDFDYSYIGEFYNGYAIAYDNESKAGVIDVNGKIVVPFDYYSILPLPNNYFCVSDRIKYGLYNKYGNKLVDCKYDRIHGFYDGLAKVENNGKCGFINETGKEVVACFYDMAFYFNNGTADVKRHGRWGVLYKSGNDDIPSPYTILQQEMDRLFTILDKHCVHIIPLYDESTPRKLVFCLTIYNKEEVEKKGQRTIYPSKILTDIGIFNDMIKIIKRNIPDSIGIFVEQINDNFNKLELSFI